jgi:CubicO group peptidase (beta-lactamase class C family)
VDNRSNVDCLDKRLSRDVLSQELAELAIRHHVPGAQVAVHHDGETIASETGELECGTGRRVTAETAFPVGSITKCFTATLAMILASDGDIDPDEPVADCMPELGELDPAVSLVHLLSHTSGLAASHGRGQAPAATLRRHVLEHVCREDLVSRPGAGFSYSNSGYAVAGQLIEAVTGMPWAQALEMILLRPLGIEPALVGVTADGRAAGSTAVGAAALGSTALGAPAVGGTALGAAAVGGTAPGGTDGAPRPVATGHSVHPVTARTVAVRQQRTPADAPAGALAVSALDLVSLGLLHVGQGDPHLLPAQAAARMREAVPAALPFGLADGWGLGLALYQHGSRTWAGHDGNGEGTACYLRICPEDGWVIALTCNAGTGGALWHDLLAVLARHGVPIGPPALVTPSARPVPPPSRCAGTYANGDLEFCVSEQDGAVYLTVDGDSSAPLTFHEDMAFSVIDPASGRRVFGGRFVPDPETGDIYGMQVGGRFARQLVHAGSRPATSARAFR